MNRPDFIYIYIHVHISSTITYIYNSAGEAPGLTHSLHLSCRSIFTPLAASRTTRAELPQYVARIGNNPDEAAKLLIVLNRSRLFNLSPPLSIFLSYLSISCLMFLVLLCLRLYKVGSILCSCLRSTFVPLLLFHKSVSSL
jgi:hypothetical protein